MGRIAYLLRHVCAGFDANKATSSSCQTHHGGQRDASPFHIVLEEGEYISRGASVAHDPQRDDDCEETCKVEYHDDTLDDRELLRAKDVEDKTDCEHSPDDQHAVPRWRNIGGIPEDDESKDLLSGEVSYEACGSLPAQDSQPANDVADEFLAASWSELADPVILSA